MPHGKVNPTPHPLKHSDVEVEKYDGALDSIVNSRRLFAIELFVLATP